MKSNSFNNNNNNNDNNEKEKIEDLTPGLTMEEDEERGMSTSPNVTTNNTTSSTNKNTIPSYKPAWRPPTPPSTSTSDPSSSSSSWITSLLPKKNGVNSLSRNDSDNDNTANSPTPAYAFGFSSSRGSSNRSSHNGGGLGDSENMSSSSMLDETLLLQDESVGGDYRHKNNDHSKTEFEKRKKVYKMKSRKKDNIRASIMNKLIPSKNNDDIHNQIDTSSNNNTNNTNNTNISSSIHAYSYPAIHTSPTDPTTNSSTDILVHSHHQHHSNNNDVNDETASTMDTNYQMMNDQTELNNNNMNNNTTSGNERQKRKNLKKRKNKLKDFFFAGIDDEKMANQYQQQQQSQQQQQQPSHWSMNYTNQLQQSNKYYGCEYFTNTQSRKKYVQEYQALNSESMDGEECLNAEDRFDDNDQTHLYDHHDEDNDDFLDFKTLFTFGCSPTSREKELSRRGLTPDDEDLPAISDIRKSSLSYMVNGRVQLRLPNDRVRLVMVENNNGGGDGGDFELNAGILSVEKRSYSKKKRSRSATIDEQPQQQQQPQQPRQQQNSHQWNSDPQTQSQLDIDVDHYDDNDDKMKKKKSISPLIATTIHDVQPQEISTPLLSPPANLYPTSPTIFRPNPATTSRVYKKKHTNDISPSSSSSKLTELNYVLTVDQDIYKRVLSEAVDSQMPCGLYYCCRDYDSKNVNINVAIGILCFVFSFILWGTLTWPTE